MSGPRYYSQNYNPSAQPRKQYQYDPGQYDAPSVHSKSPSKAAPATSAQATSSARNSAVSKPLSIRDIDLNASQYSIGSNASTMRLGGVDYPVGSRIGSSGLFIIGAPNEPKDSNSNPNRSMPSIAGSHGALVQKRMGYVSQGYGFEDWNWPMIRFSLFILLIALILALLATSIGLSVRQTDKCSFGFEWWQGPAVYQVPVGLFRDYGTDLYGDLEGLDYSMPYIQQMGVKIVMLSHFMPSIIPFWDQYTSFQGVDSRLGSQEQMRDVLSKFKDSGINVILELDVSYTSVSHQWFDESKRTSVRSGDKFEDFYTWRYQPDPSMNAGGGWLYDSVRNQYYLVNDNQYPLVNYSNPKVVEEMASDLEYWLRMGVDGFFIKDAAQMHTRSTGSTAVILGDWREKLDGYSSEQRKIIVLNADYLKSIEETSPSSHRVILDLVDLVHIPLSLKTTNLTVQLSTQVEAGLQWQRNPEDPWVMWTVPSMKKLERVHLAAVQLLLLTIPGTPCLVAGQEVERVSVCLKEKNILLTFQFFLQFLLEETKPKTLRWSADNQPYNLGSITSVEYLEYLNDIISLRNTEYALRKDHEDVGLNDKKFNINFLFVDVYNILFERYYGRSDAFYFAGNLGDRNFDHDWSRFAPYGDVVASSQDGRGNDRVELKHITMSPGEAIVLRVKK
ncbi:hypothetical protein CAPTEDRAFT_214059 [Capitella teleta]|uniref:Glycosyl hydrolase family 13 catalytic domain-containing protein n=1 Tax=Capitella teleta TaxID=283909 RepID=R7TRG3_CAPTE|nr:hypothetical protein CAPTEDRAFT_214059 [Capitella teleta]|eukprot:ELT94086.1 hypothetical protein CAPTEDRAFT_214059 [Capitella teleta]